MSTTVAILDQVFRTYEFQYGW